MSRGWPQLASAFSIGVGIGALIALVFAPQSGEETRAFLRDRAQDTVDEAVARGKKVARRAQKVAEGTREFVNDAMKTGENAFRDARNT